jgi:hypothetical protein
MYTQWNARQHVGVRVYLKLQLPVTLLCFPLLVPVLLLLLLQLLLLKLVVELRLHEVARDHLCGPAS